MHIDTSQVIEVLASRGDHEKARRDDSDLPSTVDTTAHQGLLDALGPDHRELAKPAPGLGGLGR